MAHSATLNTCSQVLNSRPNDNKSLQPRTSHSTQTTRLLVSTAAVLLVVASAGFGCYFAWHVGSQHDTILGALSIAMALGLELAKPFSIASAFTQLRQFRIITAAALTLAGLLAVAYSLQSEVTFMSMTRGDLVAQRASISDAVQRADSRYREVEAELAALKPVSSKERDTDAYLRRREALQAELHTAEHDRQSTPVVSAPDPGATALAAYAASLGWQIDTQTLGLWLPLVAVLALELGAAFSVVLVRSVTGVHVGHVAQADETGVPALTLDAADRKQPQPAKRATKSRKRRDDDDDQAGPPQLRKGIQGWVAANGGVVKVGQRELARKLGASRTSLQRALGEMAATGAVMLETGKMGTRLALAG